MTIENDAWGNRWMLGSSGFAPFHGGPSTGRFECSTMGATSETGEPTGGGPSVWYQWDCPASGQLWVGASGMAFGTVSVPAQVRLYTGSSVSALTPAPLNSGGYGGGLWQVVRGVSYLWQVQFVSADQQGWIAVEWELDSTTPPSSGTDIRGGIPFGIYPASIYTGTPGHDITVNVPTSAQPGDALVVAVISEGLDPAAVNDYSTFINQGFTVLSVVGGNQFVLAGKIWNGSPGNYTFRRNGVCWTAALMCAFYGVGSLHSGASIPSGGSDPSRVELAAPSSTGMWVGFGGVVNISNNGMLTFNLEHQDFGFNLPETLAVNSSQGGVGLAVDWQSAVTTDRYMNGLTVDTSGTFDTGPSGAVARSRMSVTCSLGPSTATGPFTPTGLEGFVGSSTGTSTFGAVSAPSVAGMQVGQLAIAWVSCQSQSEALTPTGSWSGIGWDTQWGNTFGGIGRGSMWVYAYYKTITADDVTNGFTFGSTTGLNKSLVVCVFKALSPYAGGFPAGTAYRVNDGFGPGSFTSAGQLGTESSGGTQQSTAFQIRAVSIRRANTGLNPTDQFALSGATALGSVGGYQPMVVYGGGAATTSWAWSDSQDLFQGRFLALPAVMLPPTPAAPAVPQIQTVRTFADTAVRLATQRTD
jgi:hypothetical protein